MTYRDSTGVPEWTLKRRLQDDGYLLIRDFISDDVLDKARRVVIETVERHGWGTWDARIRKLRGRPDIWDVLEPDAYNDALRAIWTHPDVYLLAHAPELMGLMRLLLGDEPFVHPLKVMRLMFPAAESTQWPARHQDFPELQGAPEQLTAWLTLFPVEPAGGALPVWPGSHRHGVLPLDLSLHPSGWEAMLPDGREPVVGNLEPGDVLVFTTYTVHGAAVNTSDYIRVSMDARYQLFSSPINVTNLKPTFLGYELEEAFCHWPDGHPLRLYWNDRHPPTVPFDRRWEQWRQAEAIRRGRLADRTARTALRIVAGEAEHEADRAEARRLLALLDSREQDSAHDRNGRPRGS